MKHSVKYNNLKLRVLGSLLAANFVVLYGVELTFYEALHKPRYHLALAVSFTIALCLTYLVHLTTVQLDRLYNWSDNLSVRIVFQFLLGFASPAVCAVAFAWTYFAIMGVDMVETGYFRMDYPIIVLMLLALNMYYIIHYLIARMRKHPQLVGLGIGDEGSMPLIQETNDLPDGAFTDGNDGTESITLAEPSAIEGETQTEAAKKLILIHSGTGNIYLDVEKDVCMFYRASDFNWVSTFDNKIYSTNQSLNALEKEYCGELFFKANRKAIIHFNAVRGFVPGPYAGSLLIELKEECRGSNSLDETLLTVSQEKAPRFREWMER